MITANVFEAKINSTVGPLLDNDVLAGDDQGTCELLGAQLASIFNNPSY
jgi:hypothetical protein